MGRFVRNNGLSLAYFGLFLVFLIGQFIAGHRTYNEMQRSHGRSGLDFARYLISGHSIEGVFENWESEFLQMGCGVLFTVFLYQKGSADSKKLESLGNGSSSSSEEVPGPEAPWPVRQGGWVLRLYENSLVLAFLALFVASFALHALGGMWQYNGEQLEHGGKPVSLAGFLATSDFWFQSFQNYQSEFLALGTMAVLSIFLRQKGSQKSKRVSAPHGKTGTA